MKHICVRKCKVRREIRYYSCCEKSAFEMLKRVNYQGCKREVAKNYFKNTVEERHFIHLNIKS
jgi:hypothetical protein